VSDIFISYASKDRLRVRTLADALVAQGWSVWWDRQIPAGQTFDHVIAEALASARCIVVLWSRQSINSNWVREEAEEGRKRGILIPVLIDNVLPPLGFGRIQAADLLHWDGTKTSEAFQKLAIDITAILGPPPITTEIQGTPTIERSPQPKKSTRTRIYVMALMTFLGVLLFIYWIFFYQPACSLAPNQKTEIANLENHIEDNLNDNALNFAKEDIEKVRNICSYHPKIKEWEKRVLILENKGRVGNHER
jgi:hypothetical protein